MLSQVQNTAAQVNSYKVTLRISAADGGESVTVTRDMIAASEEEIHRLYEPYPNIYNIIGITKYTGGNEDGTTD